MENEVILKNSSGLWNFVDELELENFIWKHLFEIFHLEPLERQSTINGQICDILAVTQNKQLVIIELKNTEDRYVINQLTRYYDALIQEKPFKNKVDYQQDILLYAICPIFHQHNLIDVKYSKLHFELFQSSVIKEESEFYQLLKNINENKLHGKYIIQYQEIDWRKELNSNIPEPCKLLATWLDLLSEIEKFNILKIHEQILSFDKRMEEINENSSIFYGIRYGNNKIRSCAEFQFDRYSKKILIFLWLADIGISKKPIVRMQVDTFDNYIHYSRLIVVKKNSVSFINLKNVDVGHKFYCYLEQQEGISLKIMRPSVAKGYNRMYKEWKKSGFYLKDPIEFIIENALTILSKKMPKR